jgi:hypothetical protein
MSATIGLVLDCAEPARLAKRSEPELGPVAGAVVGEGSLDGDAVDGEPGVGAPPERSGGDGLFVGEDLGVGEAGAVVDGGVDEPIAGAGALHDGCLAAAVDPPSAAGRDAGDLLDVNVDQLAGPVALRAANRFDVGSAITGIEPAETLTAQDGLHRRGSQAELMTDVGSAPTMPSSQRHHPPLQRQASLVRGSRRTT